ncbi:MAG: hypothetical protein ABL958_08535 [Bdellovibrionia bacterium]
MKAILGLLFVTLAAVNVQAANPLKEHMEAMDKTYKAVLKQVGNAAQNPSSIKMFQDLEKLTYECIAILPARLDFLALDEARIKQIVYQRMMSQLLIMILDGEEMLQKSDNAGAKGVLGKMAELKFAGHQIFKP